MSEVEHKMVSLTIDEQLRSEIAKLESEGWQMAPGVPPVAVYHLMRQKPDTTQQPSGALGKVKVDDTKVHILRNGQIVG